MKRKAVTARFSTALNAAPKAGIWPQPVSDQFQHLLRSEPLADALERGKRGNVGIRRLFEPVAGLLGTGQFGHQGGQLEGRIKGQVNFAGGEQIKGQANYFSGSLRRPSRG